MPALDNLADVCRATGWPVAEVAGWEERGRRGAGGHLTYGYRPGAPNHIMVHHTASSPAADGWPDVRYCTYNDDAAPLCNIYLSRDGTIYVCAAMATNTNGSGHDPCGLLADDTMNANAIGIEAGNTGLLERWPDRQLDSYAALCRELCAAYGIPTGRIHAHWEYTGRKRDPAGPDRYAHTAAPWNMDAFRADCTPSEEEEIVTDHDIERIADAVWAKVLTLAQGKAPAPAEVIVADTLVGLQNMGAQVTAIQHKLGA